ncbi:MAG: SpoVA/SpoVAEb family sporulation membrane protein [Lachnospiraceae bacterium]|nr:SpoVA/SpoVAEb family sporulation membrane protein [Lachnospiraceae bacterium]
MDQKKKEYQEYVEQTAPKTNLWMQMAKAFVTGGIICCIGQLIVNTAMEQFGLEKDIAGNWCSMLLILASVILTGFDIYPKIVKWGGAGGLVPITGFANSVAASAIEYKTDASDIICTRSKKPRKIKGFR